MPFEQLRALVCLLIESEEEALWEREPRPPTHHPVEPGLPSQPRVSTLDEVIASLPRR
jgi:hypothetical protein